MGYRNLEYKNIIVGLHILYVYVCTYIYRVIGIICPIYDIVVSQILKLLNFCNKKKNVTFFIFIITLAYVHVSSRNPSNLTEQL